MANRPSTPEIITVNSEALQTQIRDLLPSQNGFGSELQASNIITPIIDLTAAAEGSSVPQNLQTALAFGSQTAFEVNNTTSTLANSPGFYRVTGAYSNFTLTSGDVNCAFSLTDGASTKVVWKARMTVTSPATQYTNGEFDLIFWLAAGESITATAALYSYIAGSYRQIADSAGKAVNPSGFPL